MQHDRGAKIKVKNNFGHSTIRKTNLSHGNRWFPITLITSRPTYKMVRRLTLRLLMSYIYMEHLFLMFLDHTQRRSTVGRTPLDE